MAATTLPASTCRCSRSAMTNGIAAELATQPHVATRRCTAFLSICIKSAFEFEPGAQASTRSLGARTRPQAILHCDGCRSSRLGKLRIFKIPPCYSNHRDCRGICRDLQQHGTALGFEISAEGPVSTQKELTLLRIKQDLEASFRGCPLPAGVITRPRGLKKLSTNSTKSAAPESHPTISEQRNGYSPNCASSTSTWNSCLQQLLLMHLFVRQNGASLLEN